MVVWGEKYKHDLLIFDLILGCGPLDIGCQVIGLGTIYEIVSPRSKSPVLGHNGDYDYCRDGAGRCGRTQETPH